MWTGVNRELTPYEPEMAWTETVQTEPWPSCNKGFQKSNGVGPDPVVFFLFLTPVGSFARLGENDKTQTLFCFHFFNHTSYRPSHPIAPAAEITTSTAIAEIRTTRKQKKTPPLHNHNGHFWLCPSPLSQIVLKHIKTIQQTQSGKTVCLYFLHLLQISLLPAVVLSY